METALRSSPLTRIALTPVASLPPRVRASLCALVAAGTLWHGSLPFVPGFDPYDVEVVDRQRAVREPQRRSRC